MKKLIFALSFAAASAATFTATQHSVSLAYSPYGKPLVRYENGFFVAYDRADPSVSSFDGTGRPVVYARQGNGKFSPCRHRLGELDVSCRRRRKPTPDGSRGCALCLVLAGQIGGAGRLELQPSTHFGFAWVAPTKWLRFFNSGIDPSLAAGTASSAVWQGTTLVDLARRFGHAQIPDDA
jgi:hypothetical protein